MVVAAIGVYDPMTQFRPERLFGLGLLRVDSRPEAITLATKR